MRRLVQPGWVIFQVAIVAVVMIATLSGPNVTSRDVGLAFLMGTALAYLFTGMLIGWVEMYGSVTRWLSRRRGRQRRLHP